MKRILIGAALTCLASIAPAQERQPGPAVAVKAATKPAAETPATVLVEIGDHQITAADLSLSTVLLAGAADTLPPEKIRRLVLMHLVDVRVAADAALAEGATPEIARLAAVSVGDKVAPPPAGETPEAKARRLSYLETAALAETYFKRRETKLALDDDSLRRRYDEMVNTREIRFRYLVVDTKDAAETARRRIAIGEPFEKVARDVSADPDTSKKGGDLGYLLESTLTPVFSGLAKSLEPGQMSKVFRTEMGWNVAMLVDRRQVVAPSFNKMKESMRKAIVEDMRKGVTEDLRARAHVVWHTEKPPGF